MGDVNDTGGELATCVIVTGGKFTAGVVDTGSHNVDLF